ncbi:MAG: nuclear transport factor 2 family protein [Geminicoccaceae bacterium]
MKRQDFRQRHYAGPQARQGRRDGVGRTIGGGGSSGRSDMGEREIRAPLARQRAASDADGLTTEHAICRQDAVLDRPPSGERIRGRRIVGAGGLRVAGHVPSHDRRPARTVSVMEHRDGEPARATRQRADPFAPGPSRARRVERTS